ncbi:hypothetical protein N7495_006846 [Penicillium taxi]|uniref:uncharacterized protein n=1 Tax=Penicillium taxi TaxID=168475 RepID=UPI002545377B|nr:uncharacterized protein N7495_006846 [Penicillium taxi]KAJ5895155.1 hypothetical protein N7495_006846 [Penicillium taxi]
MAKRKSTVESDSPSKRLRNSSVEKTPSELPPTETSEKRGRGRPRKNPEAATPLLPPSELDTPKRGRGRPPKSPAVAATAAAAKTSTNSSTKRGRGRPPKAGTIPKEIVSKEVGRGRGRPRQSIPSEEVTKSSDVNAKAESGDSNIPEDLLEELPRGRGRPRKSIDAIDATVTGEASRGRGRPRKSIGAIDATVTGEASRGRGRPRKSIDATDATVTGEASRGRGRPRKSIGAIDATVTGGASRGRGRPRKSIDTNGATATEATATDSTATDATSVADVITEVVNATVPEERGPSYWLMKAEPESRIEKGADVKFSIDDLAAAKVPEPWDGVRNAVARNLMRDMKKGDYAFFYHSNCKVPGVVGVMEIVNEHSADESAYDPKHPYYDPKSTRGIEKWVVVHVEFRHKLQKQVTLNELKSHSQPGQALENLQTLKQSRLSVSSVTPAQWRFIMELAGEDPAELMKAITKPNSA